MKISKDTYKSWLQTNRPGTQWDEQKFNFLYDIIDKYGFGAINNYDLIPPFNLMDGNNSMIDLTATDYNPIPVNFTHNHSHSIFEQVSGNNSFINGAYLGPKPFKWEDYTGEVDVPEQAKDEQIRIINGGVDRQIHMQKMKQQQTMPLTKIQDTVFPPQLTKQQLKQQEEEEKTRKFYKKKQQEQWKKEDKQHIAQILRYKKQVEIIEEFYQIIEDYVKRYQDQLKYVANHCSCKKLQYKLLIIADISFRHIQLVTTDDIKSYKLTVKALNNEFYNYDHPDIRRLYLYFTLTKSLYQMLIKFGKLRQDLLLIPNEPQQPDFYNNVQGIRDWNIQEKGYSKAAEMNKCFILLNKAKKYIKNYQEIFDQLWLLMDHQWVLDKYHDYDARQHIKNIESNIYIPKKNRVSIVDESFKKSSQLTIAFYNINYKQHIQSKKISKQVLQKKLATIKKLWIAAKDCTAICLQEIQAGINVNSFISYYLPYDHDIMNKQLGKLNQPSISKDANRSGGLATFFKRETTHTQVQVVTGVIQDIFFTQVFKIPSGDSWIFLVNCYIFPDWQRKKVVIQELEYIIYTLKQVYQPCNIIIVGDFNQDISKLNANQQHFKYGLRIVHPDQYTHKNISTIDYALVSEDIECQTQIINMETDHHMTILSTDIKSKTVRRWQTITSNKKVNKALQPLYNPFDIISTQHYQTVQWELRKNLYRKIKIQNIKNPLIEFIQNIQEDDLADIYCKKFNSQIFMMKFISNPKKYYSLVKRYFKLNKTSPVIKQITKDGNVLTEQQTDKALLEEYKSIYGLNIPKQLVHCRPARILISPLDLIKIRKKLNPDKAISDNLIPFSLYHINCNMIYLSCSLTNIVTKLYPSQFYFQSRMMFFNKNKNVEFPTLDEVRPITVTSAQQKPIEYMLKNLMKVNKHVFHFGQLGFIAGQETYMHLLRLLAQLAQIRNSRQQLYDEQQIPTNQRPNEEVRLLFVDIFKAFDSLPHKIFFDELKSTLNDDNVYNAVLWYFNQLGVNIGQERIPVNKGSPQGSAISPFFWIVFFNPLLIALGQIVDKKFILCYADDLLVICLTEEIMLKVKQFIDEWAIKTNIKINYKKDKTAFVKIADRVKRGRKKKENLDPIIYGNLRSQSDYKYLGVTINQNLLFPIKKLDQCKEIASLLRFQDISVKRKITLFQAFILGKFRHTLIAIKLYPQPDLQLKIENKILGLLRMTINLLKTSPKDKLMQQDLIKNSVAGIINYADTRVLKKLQKWENEVSPGNPFDWMQYKEWFQYTPADQIWECNYNNDCFWLRLLIDNKKFFVNSWCKACEKNVEKNTHIHTCQQLYDLVIMGIQKDSFEYLNYDLFPTQIIELIFNPSKFHQIAKGKKSRTLLKETFAYHINKVSKLWVQDINGFFSKKKKQGKKNKKRQTKQQHNLNRFPNVPFDQQIVMDAQIVDPIDLEDIDNINDLSRFFSQNQSLFPDQQIDYE